MWLSATVFVLDPVPGGAARVPCHRAKLLRAVHVSCRHKRSQQSPAQHHAGRLWGAGDHTRCWASWPCLRCGELLGRHDLASDVVSCWGILTLPQMWWVVGASWPCLRCSELLGCQELASDVVSCWGVITLPQMWWVAREWWIITSPQMWWVVRSSWILTSPQMCRVVGTSWAYNSDVVGC